MSKEEAKLQEMAHEIALNMLINGDVRQCKKCKQVKPLDSFYKNYGVKGTVKNECKDCYAERRKVARPNYYKNKGSLLAVEDREYQDTDLTLHNYKEPLTPVPDGFGYYGTITSTNDGRYIQCHICGKLYANLGGHLYAAHKMGARAYKDQFGLKYTSALISEQERMHLKTKSLEWVKTLTEEQKKEFIAKQKEAYQSYGKAKRDRKGQPPEEKLEQKNEKGSCPDQVLAKIKEVADDLGHTPSKLEFIESQGSQRYVHLAYKLFGSWTLALELAGLKAGDRKLIRAEGKDYTPEQLLESLRDFAIQHGEKPTKSDFKRGVLPPYPRYIEVFGSLASAYREAELSEILGEVL